MPRFPIDLFAALGVAAHGTFVYAGSRCLVGREGWSGQVVHSSRVLICAVLDLRMQRRARRRAVRCGARPHPVVID